MYNYIIPNTNNLPLTNLKWISVTLEQTVSCLFICATGKNIQPAASTGRPHAALSPSLLCIPVCCPPHGPGKCSVSPYRHKSTWKQVNKQMFVLSASIFIKIIIKGRRQQIVKHLKSAPREAAMAFSSLCILLSFFPTQITTPVRGAASFSETLHIKWMIYLFISRSTARWWSNSDRM